MRFNDIGEEILKIDKSVGGGFAPACLKNVLLSPSLARPSAGLACILIWICVVVYSFNNFLKISTAFFNLSISNGL